MERKHNRGWWIVIVGLLFLATFVHSQGSVDTSFLFRVTNALERIADASENGRYIAIEDPRIYKLLIVDTRTGNIYKEIPR